MSSSASRLMAVGCLVAAALGVGLAFDETRVWVLVGLGVTALVIAVITQPALTVLAYAASRPLADLAVFVRVGPLTVGQWWGAGLIALMGAYWVLRPAGSRPPTRASFAPLLFALLYALLTVWRPDAVFAVSNVVKLVSWLLLIPTVEDIATNAQGQRWVLFAGGAASVVLLGVVAFSVATDRYGAAYYAGTLLDVGQGPHGLASIAVMDLSFVLLLGVLRPGRWLPLVLTALLGVAVALSFVRTTFLAYCVVLAVFLVWSLRGRGMRSVLTATAAVAALGTTIYVLQDQVVGRLSDLRFIGSGGGSQVWAGGGRVGIWLAVLAGSTDSAAHLVYGLGAGSSFALVYTAMGASVWAHNDFLEFLVTGGVLLLGGYLVLVAWMWRSMGAFPKEDSASRGVSWIGHAAVLAFVFMAFFNGIAFYQASVMMGMLVGLYRGFAATEGPAAFSEVASGGVPAWMP